MLPERIELEQSGPVVTVRVRVPQVTHLQMQEIVEDCLVRVRCHNATYVLMDLEEVQFLSSECIGSIVMLLQELEHVRGRMALLHCSDNITFLFKVTRLDAVVGLFEDEKEALASF